MQNYVFLGTVEGEDKYALQIAQKLIESFNYFNRINRYSIKQNSIHTFTYNKNYYEIIVSSNPNLPIFNGAYSIDSKIPYCRIREKRPNGQIRFEILFQFQTSPRRLLKLFYISHSNIRMEYRNYYVPSIQTSFTQIPLN